MTDRSDDGLRVSPVVARRQLLRRFVEARREAGFVSRELAAEALGWSPRKQALLESGEQPIPLKDLDAILPAFKIAEDEWPKWQALAELARAKGWWDAYDDADLSVEGKRFIGYEWGARRIRTFDGSIMPALLQIPGYTSAALGAGVSDRPPEQIERLQAVRRQRQRALGKPDPLDYQVVLDEAALRRPGGDGDTMRAQLAHVVDLSETRANITVQVVPFSAGLYPAQSGTFVIIDFDLGEEDPGMVHVEPGFDGSLYMEERHDIYLYSRVFQRLLEVALSPADSMDLLLSVAAESARKMRS
jgi:transcriptional regulator with XRE-family HTH domain